ncbi:MAG: carboxy terminal-processing peptidase [Planctomycetaceae bacterium]|nr:carboxy terminal-processing peptidase [Planctomycetaceae bacterium]
MIGRKPSRASSKLVLAVMLILGTSFFAQQFSSAAPEEQQIAKLVAQIVPRYHINQVQINDAVSEQLFDRYFDTWDSQKLYFLQEDIDRFSKVRTMLDDAVKVGNVDFAYQVFDTYRTRLGERYDLVEKLIDQDFDFTKDESIVIDGDDLAWAASTAEIDDRWRKRVKYELLQLKLAEAAKQSDDSEETEPAEDPMVEARDRLHKRYRNNKRNIDQTGGLEVLEVYLTTLTNCFDPHSSYMSPDTVKDFTIQMKLSLDGIGASLRSEDGYTIVHEIIPGGAAAEDGRLKVGDKIIGVGQAEGEIEDIVDLKLRRVVEKIRGPRGTIVRLQVKPETGVVQIYDLVRKKIELKESEVKGEIIETDARVGRKGRIGLLSIPSFYRDFAGASGGGDNFKSAARDVEMVLHDFARQGGVDAIVIDLRDNGGGSLTEAIEVSGHFIDHGPVVQVKDSDGRVRAYPDDRRGVLYSGPLVVLCNRASASASEIFAGVIKDYHRGLIVGDSTTHGKGTVQNVMPVEPREMLNIFRPSNSADQGSLKLTISQFYRVNGDSTQNRGVQSDIVLPSVFDHLDVGEMYLDNALPFEHIPEADYVPDRKVNDEIRTVLRKSSADRVAHNEEFGKVQEAIRRYLERKNRKSISLNEDVLREEREVDDRLAKAINDRSATGDAVPIDETPSEEPDGAKEKKLFAENFYTDEVLDITLDYVDALNQMKTVQR